VKTGDVLIVCGNQSHYYDDVRELSLVNILYLPAAVSLNTYDIAATNGFPVLFGMPQMRSRHKFRSRFCLKPKDLSTVLAYVDSLEHELAHDHPGREYFAYSYFRLIVGLLSRFYSREHEFDAIAIERLAEVLNHMERHFAEPLSMEILTKIAQMTERSFLRNFHLATGTTPHNYLLQMRINRAADELRNSRKQITAIAFDVGFNDSNYFTRQFKKRIGMTPILYRNIATAAN
jgi:AraC family L-rhamnose operon transcriptional activator RhaR/AraC family L-rhamnose operon regulatory protein RhaS